MEDREVAQGKWILDKTQPTRQSCHLRQRQCRRTCTGKVKRHQNRYVTQFAGKHNFPEYDTVDQVSMIVRGVVGKRLKFNDLIG